ncbi:hypothetical protein GAYE_SCF31G4928 [Galdieria yellowstonensis]|uniref:SF3 helicase domain-containing protein n=1 Tax=Galdieria yellowstonensis TaxID=3028027 RepID=A0AAV9IHS2_9RHOD|nr:hypothetical protein GAYE_SCF31G4928 [Galdieria yellowstonensis]
MQAMEEEKNFIPYISDSDSDSESEPELDTIFYEDNRSPSEKKRKILEEISKEQGKIRVEECEEDEQQEDREFYTEENEEEESIMDSMRQTVLMVYDRSVDRRTPHEEVVRIHEEGVEICKLSDGEIQRFFLYGNGKRKITLAIRNSCFVEVKEKNGEVVHRFVLKFFLSLVYDVVNLLLRKNGKRVFLMTEIGELEEVDENDLTFFLYDYFHRDELYEIPSPSAYSAVVKRTFSKVSGLEETELPTIVPVIFFKEDNILWDLKKNKKIPFLDPRKSAKCITVTYRFDDGAPGTEFVKAFSNLFKTAKKRKLFCKILGAIALMELGTVHRKMLLIIGHKRAGKSSLLTCIANAFQKYVAELKYNFLVEELTENNKHSADLYSLYDKALLLIDEIDPHRSIKPINIKKLVGGASSLTCRPPYGKEMTTFHYRGSIILSGNHVPSFSDWDEATRDRVVMMTLDRLFEKPLNYKFEEKGDEMLKFIISACVPLYLNEGLSQEELKFNLDNEKTENYLEWMKNNFIYDVDKKVSAEKIRNKLAATKPEFDINEFIQWLEQTYGKESKNKKIYYLRWRAKK